MNIFSFLGKKKEKKEVITTILNGEKAKGRQAVLENLSTYHDPLKAYLDLKNNSLVLAVGKSSEKIAGTVDSKIVRHIEEKYYHPGGIACSIEIGENYTISKNNNNYLICKITMTIIPK